MRLHRSHKMHVFKHVQTDSIVTKQCEKGHLDRQKDITLKDIKGRAENCLIGGLLFQYFNWDPSRMIIKIILKFHKRATILIKNTI